MSTWDLSSAPWRTSSLTRGGNKCVEVAPLEGVVAVRDSKDREGPALVFDAAAWRAFVDGADRL